MEWQFNGKIKSHEKEITSICFGESLDEKEQIMFRLFSIGMDRRLFEYDVMGSTIKGLNVVNMFEIEKEARFAGLPAELISSSDQTRN